MMNKVVVTGGAGFIGSHLTEALVSRNYDVVVIDDLSTGKEENLERLTRSQGITFVKGSIEDTELLGKLFRDVQAVFHLAAKPSVPRSIEDPESSHRINATGTLKVLIAAKDNAVRKVIYSSSSSVYGDTPALPKREDMTPNPRSPYAVAKLAGEHYCQVFQKVYGITTICLRYFNVFGPRQDPNSQYAAVIPRIIKSCLNHDSPVIFDDGEQTRDFTFVSDVVKANILAVASDAEGIYNISRGESITINRLAGLIAELTGSQVQPVYHEPRPGDIRHSLADISQARTFGYNPEYSLKKGLIKTIEWFKNEKTNKG